MTEHNLFQEVKEDLERQRIEALWKRYGSWIVSAALVVVLGTAGSSAYRSWKAEHDQRLTGGFLQAAKPNADIAKNIADLQKFADENMGSNQADLALLHAGALAASQNDKIKAAQSFDAIAHDEKAEPAFRQLGDLLSVQAQMDSGDAVALSARLEPLTDEHGIWHYSALEAQGYLALKAGDKEKAKKIFTTLSQDARAPQGIGERASDIMRGLN